MRRHQKKMPLLRELRKIGDVVHRASNHILETFWRDKREVALLSTIHMPRMVLSQNYDLSTRERIMKPGYVLDYSI